MFENGNIIEFIAILSMSLAMFFYFKYQYIKSSMEGYYQYVKPDASKQEIKSFIDKLSKIDDYNNIVDTHNRLVKDHNEMVGEFCGSLFELVNNFDEIFNVFHELNADIWDNCYVSDEKVKEIFDKHKDQISHAYDSFDEIIDDLNKLLKVWKENEHERK